MENPMRTAPRLPTLATSALACCLAAAALTATGPAFAQAMPGNPTMTNVIPDSGNFAARGRIGAINAAARTLTITPSSGTPVEMTAPASISLDGLSAGDHVSSHYSRTVAFVVG